MDTLNNPNLYLELRSSNIIPGMKRGRMFDPGRWIDTESAKLHQMGAIDPDVGWIYVCADPRVGFRVYTYPLYELLENRGDAPLVSRAYAAL